MEGTEVIVKELSGSPVPRTVENMVSLNNLKIIVVGHVKNLGVL
jgi:hypothetical protein